MEVIMKKFTVLLILMAMLGGMLAGCGGGTAPAPTPATPPAQPGDSAPDDDTPTQPGDSANQTTFGIEPLQNRTTLSVGYFSGAMHSLPFYIMDEMGWIDELNIDFTYQSFIVGPAMMEANASWDIASAGAPGALVGILGFDIQVLGIADLEAVLNLYVREDSPIAQAGQGNFPGFPQMYGTVDAWRGTEWLLPIGTTMHQTLVTVLEQIGLTADDVTMINMDVTTALTAFIGGAGDGLAVWTSTALAAEQEGFIKAGGADDNGVVVPTAFLATDRVLADAQRLEAVTKVWELYFRTMDWIIANLEDAAHFYAESAAIEGVSGADDFELSYATLLRFNPYGLNDQLELMTTTGNDPAGLAARPLSGGEIDLFNTLDFFITQDRYSNDERNFIIDNNKVSSVVAQQVAESIAAR